METLFRKTLEDSPQLRILEFFVEGRELDYSFDDIKEETNIKSIELSNILIYLVKLKIITPIKNDNIISHKLNLNNSIAKKAIEVFDEIIK